MIRFISRHNKDYSRYNIVKGFAKDVSVKNDMYILLPFSKNQFFKYFFRRKQIINDFFISNYDTYVYDRKKISKWNPRAWWKYTQDWVNFHYSKYLLSDTYEHFKYWEELFGKFSGELFVLPVFADTSIYYPAKEQIQNTVPKIIFFGSFIPLHGVDVILKAFKLLEDRGIKFEADLIGNGQTYPAMKELFESLNLKQVRMDGLLMKENELADEIRKSDIVLGIFGESKKAFSVVPNKTYQALACKKPLITMKTRSNDEFFDGSHFISCENKPNVLALHIETLLNDPEARSLLAEQGYQRFNELYEEKKGAFTRFLEQIDHDLEQQKGVI